MTMSEGPITYEQSGVDYKQLDPFKVAAQRAAGQTAVNLFQNFGYNEVTATRGESAFVWDEGDKYQATVTEGLGTKNLVADGYRKPGGPTYYDAVGQDTIAMIVNDIITVGAFPKVIGAHMSVANAEWFSDVQRANDLVNGWKRACDLAGATWGGGETPALKGILMPGVIELSGNAVGEIYPKERLTLGEKLQEGDAIVIIESSGVHANGITLARTVAGMLPDGYDTLLSNGRAFGEALLTPTPIYVPAIRALFENGIDVHYMANITGHGWRKLMRADKELTYHIHSMPEPQPEFELIQQVSGNDDEEMYGNFNMGAGYAVYVSQAQVKDTLALIQEAGFRGLHAGDVLAGSKQVVLEPIDLTFAGDSLKVR